MPSYPHAKIAGVMQDENRFKKECDVEGFLYLQQGTRYTFDQFRRLTKKWHLQVSSMFRKCLVSKDHLQIGNTLSVLHRLKGVRMLCSSLKNHL